MWHFSLNVDGFSFIWYSKLKLENSFSLLLNVTVPLKQKHTNTFLQTHTQLKQTHTQLKQTHPQLKQTHTIETNNPNEINSKISKQWIRYMSLVFEIK